MVYQGLGQIIYWLRKKQNLLNKNKPFLLNIQNYNFSIYVITYIYIVTTLLVYLHLLVGCVVTFFADKCM